jgi:hypothetical protein
MTQSAEYLPYPPPFFLLEANPHRGIDQNHAGSDYPRGMGRTCESLPPSRASRRVMTEGAVPELAWAESHFSI